MDFSIPKKQDWVRSRGLVFLIKYLKFNWDYKRGITGALTNLAWYLINAGKYDNAAQLYKTSLKIREKLLGEDH